MGQPAHPRPSRALLALLGLGATSLFGILIALWGMPPEDASSKDLGAPGTSPSLPSVAALSLESSPEQPSGVRSQLGEAEKTETALEVDLKSAEETDPWAAAWRGKPITECLSSYWGMSQEQVRQEFRASFGGSPRIDGLLDQPVGEGVRDWDSVAEELFQKLREQLAARAGTIDHALFSQGLDSLSGLASRLTLALERRNPGSNTPTYSVVMSKLQAGFLPVLDRHADYMQRLTDLLETKLAGQQYDRFPIFTFAAKRVHTAPREDGLGLVTLNASAHGWNVQLNLRRREDPRVDLAHGSVGASIRKCLAEVLAALGYPSGDAEVDSILTGSGGG